MFFLNFEGQGHLIVGEFKYVVFDFGFFLTAVDLKLVFALSYYQGLTAALIYNRHCYKLKYIKKLEKC